MLDFAEIKKIKIIEVAARYGVRLKYRGDWGSGPCPLPTHRKDDRGRNFTVNVRENYWRCFSQSCNDNNEGRKGGDVINFVALMENCREKEAAQKLAEWYGLASSVPIPENVTRQSTKTARQIAERPERSELRPDSRIF